MDFYPNLTKWGPEYTVAFLSDEFFEMYISPDMKKIHQSISLSRKHFKEYSEKVWECILAEHGYAVKQYIDSIIRTLDGDKENEIDRTKALGYMKDYINEHKLIKLFRTI